MLDGDAAVYTLPLGVLRAGAVAFEPPLPGAPADAVRALGVGVLDKVALRFPEVFWDPEAHVLGVLDDNGQAFASFVILLSSTERPILVGLVAGAGAGARATLGRRHRRRGDDGASGGVPLTTHLPTTTIGHATITT